MHDKMYLSDLHIHNRVSRQDIDKYLQSKGFLVPYIPIEGHQVYKPQNGLIPHNPSRNRSPYRHSGLVYLRYTREISVNTDYDCITTYIDCFNNNNSIEIVDDGGDTLSVLTTFKCMSTIRMMKTYSLNINTDIETLAMVFQLLNISKSMRETIYQQLMNTSQDDELVHEYIIDKENNIKFIFIKDMFDKPRYLLDFINLNKSM